MFKCLNELVDYMNIHFIGIGGIGVSALAQYYIEKGHKVSGSDLNLSGNTELLEKKGAKIYIGEHKAENLTKDVSLVVYSPAVQSGNVELEKARKAGQGTSSVESKIQIMSYPEALGTLTRKYFTIAVSGTHGKSTTASMVANVLIKAGFDPTVIIGTKLKEFGNSNYRAGDSKYLIIEADEHFASFLNYNPDILILTNIEKDHLDYYKNLDNILESFRKYLSLIKEGGVLILNKDDKNIPKLGVEKISSQKFKVLEYSLRQEENERMKKTLKIPGDHNVSNALAVLTLSRELKISDEVTFETLSNYKGSWRRFEIRKSSVSGIDFLIVSDYGHHPTEVLATLRATREKWPEKKIHFIFQPHQYQRTFYLFNDFINSFKKCLEEKLFDIAIIADIFDVAGRESDDIRKKINSKKLVEEINDNYVLYLKKEEILRYLKNNIGEGDVVIIMGAGDIYKLGDQFYIEEG